MINLHWSNGVLTTEGLSALGAHEIGIAEPRIDWRNDAQELLSAIANYVMSSGRVILAEETMNYGFWLIKFRTSPNAALAVHEYNENGTEFVPGAKLAMEFWRDQHYVCKSVNAEFAPPRPDELVAISQDLPQVHDVEGVRYELGPSRSGWIITSRGFDGPVQSLRQEHLLHLVDWRRDLIRYLALPVGFRFASNGESHVWFDQKVAATR